MRFVLGNRHLLAAGGTEVHLVTIGEHLRRLGHEVTLYAPELGPFADHARRRGLDVTASLRELPDGCDVVFAQDAIVVCDLAARYPDALSVFRICGDVFDFQLAPQLAGLVDLVVVLSDRYERLAASCAVRAPVLRLRMPIDIDRLVSLGALRERPERAVLLGNYGERDALIREVWGDLGVEIRSVGGSAQSYDVASAVADADVVVAKSRAALDAMACGRAVYVFDFLGGDGWVTPERYPALEADNFAGQATGRVIDAAALTSDLSDYRAEMGAVNRDLILQHHSARDHVIALLSALAEHVPDAPREPAPMREMARLIAMQWSWELTAREFRSMHWQLREHAATSERRSAQAAESARLAQERAARSEALSAQAAVDRAQAETARDEALAHAARLDAQLAEAQLAHAASTRQATELHDELAALRATRVWRMASAYWRLAGRLRRTR